MMKHTSRPPQIAALQAADGAAPGNVLDDLQPIDAANWTLADTRVWYVQRDERERAWLAVHDLSDGSSRRLGRQPRMLYKSGLAAGSDGRIYFASVVRSEADLVMMERR